MNRRQQSPPLAYEGRPLVRPDEEIVDQGQGADVATLMGRRRMLRTLRGRRSRRVRRCPAGPGYASGRRRSRRRRSPRNGACYWLSSPADSSLSGSREAYGDQLERPELQPEIPALGRRGSSRRTFQQVGDGGAGGVEAGAHSDCCPAAH